MDMEKNDPTDIKALEILNQHLDILLTLESPSRLEQDNGLIQTVMQILSKVTHSIKKVADYVEDITEKLDDIRDIIREYDEEIAENLKTIMTKFKIDYVAELVIDTESLDNHIEVRNRLAMKRLQHYRSVQLLNKQNHELKELIVSTENSLLNCQTQVSYNNEDISSIEKHLLQWSNTLEHIEEKKLEREQHSDMDSSTSDDDKEDNPRESKYNVKSDTELHERQKWPIFVYDMKGPSRFKQRICCVLKVSTDSVDKKDILCECTDSYHLLESSLEFPDEQVLSGMISIKSVNQEQLTKFEFSIIVYIPIVQHNPTLIPRVKFCKGNQWTTGEPVPNITLSGSNDTTYVGTLIPVKDLVCLQCIAVATHRRHCLEVYNTGITYELEWDRNVKITIPDNTFVTTNRIFTKVLPWHLTDLTETLKDLNNINVLGSYLEIQCENTTESEIEINLYNLGWFVNSEVGVKPTKNQETLLRCNRWLVNNIFNPQVDDTENSEATTQNHHTAGDNIRALLQDLINCTDGEYDDFILRLQTSEQHSAVNMLSQVNKAINDSTFGEIDDDEIYGVDYPLRNEKLYILMKLDNKNWSTSLYEPKPRNPKSRLLTLRKGHNTYRMICISSKEQLTNEEINSASSVLEEMTFLTKVCVICRQNEDNIHDAIILCTKYIQMKDRLSELNDRGYSIGPPPSEVFGVMDGEEIEIRFTENVQMAKYKLFPLKIKYFSNIEPLKFSGKIDILDSNDQRGDGSHHGKLVYKVAANKFCRERSGNVEIHFPKELEKNITDFVHTEFDPVRILAKHVAWQQTVDNTYSTRWNTFAEHLVNKNMPTYRQIIKDIEEYGTSESQHDRCEAFILRWSSHYANPGIDKVQTIAKSIPEDDKRTYATKFIKQYTENNGTLTNSSLERIAYIIARSWRDIAIKLKFNSYDIGRIVLTEEGLVRQSLRMLESWRISDSVIMSTKGAIHTLSDVTVTMNCQDELLRVKHVFI